MATSQVQAEAAPERNAVEAAGGRVKDGRDGKTTRGCSHSATDQEGGDDDDDTARDDDNADIAGATTGYRCGPSGGGATIQHAPADAHADRTGREDDERPR